MDLADLAIGAANRVRLRCIASDVSTEEAREFRRLLPAASARARFVADHWDFTAPARAIDDVLFDTYAFSSAVDPASRTRLRRAVVARLALDYFRIESRLPDSIGALYPDLFARLSTFLAEKATSGYDDDYYAKDVRYALGLSVPGGTVQIDLKYQIGPKLIWRDMIKTGSLASLAAYTASGGWGYWYNDHLDLRSMEEFNSKGWTACFVRIAEMLELNPSIRGLAGVSWFYDPAVPAISPHLAYLQELPTKHGAFLVHTGTLPHDVENATVRSFARRKLHQEGRYQPACYLLAWPRRHLIEWARRLTAGLALDSSPVPQSQCA